jgi:hypothetical protein
MTTEGTSVRAAAAACLAVWAAAAHGAPTIEQCLTTAKEVIAPDCSDASKFDDAEDQEDCVTIQRADCLAKTGDQKVIDFAYARSRELIMITPWGGRALGHRGPVFFRLAAAAGDVAAWGDHRPLLAKARSEEHYDQLFGLEALKHALLKIQMGPSDKLAERLARLREIGPEIRGACASRLPSEDRTVHERAEDCIDVCDSKPPTAGEAITAETMAEERAIRKRPPALPKGIPVFGKGSKPMGGLHAWLPLPQRLRCLHDALGPGLELCFVREPARSGPRDARVFIRRHAATSGQRHWVEEDGDGSTLVATRSFNIATREVIHGDPPPPLFLSGQSYLVYLPLVRAGEEGYNLSRAILFVFDADQRTLIQMLESPTCLLRCPAPRMKVVERHGVKELHLTPTFRAREVYRVRWTGARLEPLDE